LVCLYNASGNVIYYVKCVVLFNASVIATGPIINGSQENTI